MIDAEVRRDGNGAVDVSQHLFAVSVIAFLLSGEGFSVPERERLKSGLDWGGGAETDSAALERVLLLHPGSSPVLSLSSCSFPGANTPPTAASILYTHYHNIPEKYCSWT